MASSDPLDDVAQTDTPMGVGEQYRQQNPPLPFETPSQTADRIATVANTERRVQYGVNRMKASALAQSGVPSYTDPATGNVSPVTDTTGAPVTQYDKKSNVGYDGGGFPVQLRQSPAGPPMVEDAFTNVPTTTDPKTGDQYQIRPGLPWKYTGTDADVVQQNLQKEKDKASADLATSLGRKLSSDEHQLTQDETEYKGRARVFQKQFGLTGQEPPDDARAKIASSFDADYQSPQATETAGWFASTPSAAAVQYRQGIDQQKQQALDAFDSLQSAQGPIAQRRVLLHNEAATRTAILQQQVDRATQKAQALGAIPGVSPDSTPDAGSSPALTGASGAAQGQVGSPPQGPADHLAAAARGEKSYQYDPKAGLQFSPDKLSDGLKQATADGVVDADWAKQHQSEFDQAQSKYDELQKSAGGNQQLKALLRGAGIGAVFNEAGAAAAPAGAAAGAAVSGPFAEIGAPIGAGLAYLTAGGLASWAAKKGLDKLADYSDAVKSLNSAAALHPGWAAAGQLAGGARQIVQGASNLAQLSSMAGNGVEGLKAATGLLAKGAASGLAFEGVLRPAFDAAVSVTADKLGIDHEAFQAPTVQSLLTSTAVGMVAAGHSVEFKDYNAGEIASVLTRAKIRTDAGIPLDADADPAAVHAAYQKAGVNLDSQQAQEALRPLTPEEISLRNSIKAQTQKMADAGEFDKATGVKFESARQANVPGIRKGSGTQIASSVIKAVGGEEEGQPAEPTPPEPKPVKGRDVTGEASAPAAESTPVAEAETLPSEPAASAEASAPVPAEPAKETAVQPRPETVSAPAASQPETPKEQPAVQGGSEEPRADESTSAPAPQVPAAPQEPAQPATVDQAAHEAAASPQNELKPPTPAQVEGGNAKLGHPEVGPLKISIEHPEGSARKPGWSPLKGAHYGYLKGVANSGDGEKMDAFVKTGTPSDYSGPVYVVNRHPAGGGVDHKAVVGASSLQDALKIHNDNYPKGLAAQPSDVATFKDTDSFRKWATGAKTRRAPAKGDTQPPDAAKQVLADRRAAKDALKNVSVSLKARVADTGELVPHSMPAYDALLDLHRARNGMKALADCLEA